MGEPKFRRQPDKVSCGPTAIANALAFFDKKPPAIRAIKRLCEIDNDIGMLPDVFTRVLRMAFNGIGRISHPRFRKYRKAMRAMWDGCGVCVLYRDPLTHEGHYAFLFLKGLEFFAVNDGYKLVCPIEYGDLRAILRARWTEVWIVRLSSRTCRSHKPIQRD